MIEIKKRNGFWEAYVCGGLYCYNESLEAVLEELHDHSSSIVDDMEDE